MSDIYSSGMESSDGDDFANYFALKIKESALTRITLIDERFYDDMIKNKQEEFLTLKNIRVLNLSPCGKHTQGRIIVKDLFNCNDFRNEKDETLFLSIHLGLIEKIVKDDSVWVKEEKMESQSNSERIKKFMDELKNTFQTKFISIHSGRGNFSQDLDGALKTYPFINVSALEHTFSNSKFLLSQLFYSIVFIGKGELNERNN